MGGRISGLKNKIAALRVTIIALEMTPTNKHLASLNHKVNDLTDKLAVANEEIEHRFSNEYVKTLDDYILSLKKEVAGKQITIDALEFDMDIKEKRVKEENEIAIKLSKEIQRLKVKEQCSKDDIANLVENVRVANKNLADALETIDKLDTHIKSLDDKKIKNKIKKLFAS